jgi:heme exporter protein A
LGVQLTAAVAESGLVVRDLSRRYGPRWVLTHLSFVVPPGSALRVTGANGSGKSTLLRCLATALPPNDGAIELGGRSLWAHRASLRGSIGFLSHAARVYEDLSASDNLAVWARLGGSTVDRDAVLRRVGLDPARRDPVRAFSAGMRRRLALAVVLLKEPRLLLLDEPFTALDPAGRAVVADVVREARARGACVVMATHLPEVAAELCDRSLHLADGRAAEAA